MNDKPIRKIEETILTFFLFLLSFFFFSYFPFFFFLSLPFLPLLIFHFYLRHGLPYTLLLAFFLLFSLTIFLSFFQGLFIWLILIWFGIIQNWLIQRKITPLKLIFINTLFIFFLFIGAGLTAYYFFGTNPITFERKAIENFLDEQKKIAFSSGLTEEKVVDEFRFLEKALRSSVYLWPSGIFFYSVLISFLNFIVTRLTLKDKKLEFLDLPSFKNWHFPWYLVWGYILGLTGVFFYRFARNFEQIIFIGSINLLVSFGLLFFIQGLSILWYFFDKYKLPWWAKAVLCSVAILLQLVFQVLTWVGVFDTWFNYRKLKEAY